jgi:hypothetical protein
MAIMQKKPPISKPPVKTPPKPTAKPAQKVETKPAPQEEPVDEYFDEDFDPNAQPLPMLPVKDNVHHLKLSLADFQPESIDDENCSFEWDTQDGVRRKDFSVSFIAEVIDETDPDCGKKIFDSVNTMPVKATGGGTTNDVAQLMRKIGLEASGYRRENAIALMEALKDNPTVWAKSQWQAKHTRDYIKSMKVEFTIDPSDSNEVQAEKKLLKKKCNSPVKRGMKSFPRDLNGDPEPIYEDLEGNPVKTSAVIVEWLDEDVALAMLEKQNKG